MPLIRSAGIFLGLLLLLSQCTDTTSTIPNSKSSTFQDQFNPDAFEDVISYPFSVNWQEGKRAYSEELELTYYEYPLVWETNFNPDQLAGRHPNRLTFKLMAIPDRRGKATFYLLKFLEDGATKTPNLSWDKVESFTGRIYAINQEGKRVVAQQYNEGQLQGAVSEITKQQFQDFRNGMLGKMTNESCIVVATEHYKDWYRIYSDGSIEYTGTTYHGVTYETVCESSGGGSDGEYSGGDDTSAGGGTGSDPDDTDETKKEVKDVLIDLDPCETENELINSIESTMKDLMEKSYDFDKYQRAEYGGYLYKNSPDGETKFKPFPDSFERTPCGIDFSLDEFHAHMPDGTVGYIHTHPWSNGEMQWSCTKEVTKDQVEMWGDDMRGAFEHLKYEPGPSEPDVLMAQAFKNAGLNIDGYLIDQDNIYTYDETAKPKDLSTLLNEFERCGY